jgi:hypothetical protein
MTLIEKQTVDPNWGNFAQKYATSISSVDNVSRILFPAYTKADSVALVAVRITTRRIRLSTQLPMSGISMATRSEYTSLSRGAFLPAVPRTLRVQ